MKPSILKIATIMVALTFASISEICGEDLHSAIVAGVALRSQRHYDDAIAHFDNLITIEPGNAEAYFQRGMAMARKRDYDRALSDFTRASVIDAKHLRSIFWHGVIGFHAHPFSEAALADFTRVIELDPDNAPAYCNRATISLNSLMLALSTGRKYEGEEISEIIADYTKAIGIDPWDTTTYYERGVAKESCSDYEGALADYTRSFECATNDREACFALCRRGVVKHLQGKFADAIADYELSVKRDRLGVVVDVQWRYMLKLANAQQKPFEEQSGAFPGQKKFEALYRGINRGRHSLPLEQECGSHIHLGRIKAENGAFDEAINHYREAIRLDPYGADAYVSCGIAMDASQDRNSALSHYAKAIELDPENGTAYINQGLCFYYKGDIRRFLSCMTRAIKADERNADNHFLAWTLRVKLGELDAATGDINDFVTAHDLWFSAVEWWQHKKLAAFLTGKLEEKDFLLSATSSVEKEDGDKHCQAFFYAGIKRLATGDKSAAVELFKQCLATGRKTFVEYRMAEMELKVLQ